MMAQLDPATRFIQGRALVRHLLQSPLRWLCVRVCVCVRVCRFGAIPVPWPKQSRWPFINSTAPAQHFWQLRFNFYLYQPLALSLSIRSACSSRALSHHGALKMQIVYWVITNISFVMPRNSTLCQFRGSTPSADVVLLMPTTRATTRPHASGSLFGCWGCIIS